MNKRDDALTRRAFVWAEQDRQSLAECWPLGSKERREALRQADRLRRYRMAHWGRTKLEAALDGSKPTTIADVMKSHKPA